jgi:hypothetical protein
MSSYGSPTYYAQKMFSLYHGDTVVPLAAQGVPTKEWQPGAVDERERPQRYEFDHRHDPDRARHDEGGRTVRELHSHVPSLIEYLAGDASEIRQRMP